MERAELVLGGVRGSQPQSDRMPAWTKHQELCKLPGHAVERVNHSMPAFQLSSVQSWHRDRYPWTTGRHGKNTGG